MRRFIPDSIAGRTLIVMIVGLVFSHVLSTAFYAMDQRSSMSLIGGEHVSERMITLARLIENAPPTDRAKIVALADGSILNASLADEPNIARSYPDNLEEQILTGMFAKNLAGDGAREFRLTYRDAASAGKGTGLKNPVGVVGEARKILQVSIRLRGGGWLNSSATIETTGSLWSLRFFLSLAVMTIAVILVSGVLVYHINRPLRIFAHAANRLGTNIDAPPLAVRGPREVQEVIAAFNGMQERLKRLISDRKLMLAAVSHDLRTPITLLRLRAEFVENHEEREKMLATLADMEAMVASILGFARDDAAEEEIRPVDLVALLNAICDDIGDLGEKVVFDGPDRLVYPCRPRVLRRALTNVIENAVKFGGCANVGLRNAGDVVRIVVEDKGPGIPDAEMDAVFNPFYRLEPSRSNETGGVGLGLSVARSIIDAHGGTIALANRTGGGLHVVVDLPVELGFGAEDAARPRAGT